MKRLLLSSPSDGPTIDNVFKRIEDIAVGAKTPIGITCWNQVGMYLKAHPTTEGRLLFFGEDDPEYVNHVVLIDNHNRILKDSLGNMGHLATDHKTYKRTSNDDTLALIGKRSV